MNATDSKLAATIHAAELGRTHKIEFDSFGPHHIDYIFSHLRTVRERAEKGTILAKDIREKLSRVCLWAYADEDRRAKGGRKSWAHVGREVEALLRLRHTITGDDFRELDTGYGLNRARKATMPGSRIVELGNIGAAVLKLHWLNDPEGGAGKARYVRAKWTF